MLAMVIAKFVGSKMALLLDGLTFIISGLLIRQLDILFETEPPVAKQSNFSKIKDAFKYLLAEKKYFDRNCFCQRNQLYFGRLRIDSSFCQFCF